MKLFTLYHRVRVLGLILCMGLWVHCDIPDDLSGAYLHGDFNCAILSSIHSRVINLHNRTRPEPFICSDFDLGSYLESLAAIHTIEEINDSKFLPGIKFGYQVCDPCASPTKALHCLEHLLAINGSLPVLSDFSDFRPSMKALLGERYSELSIAVAKLLSLYMFPQISGTSSSPVLSDKLRYPSFMRVVPSDVHQAKALAKLMERFSWSWVGVVYGDDDYGRAAHQSLRKEAEGKVCLDFEEVVPHYLDHVEIDRYIKDAVNTIQASSAKVVVLILKDELVAKIFKEMIQANMSRIWIASDAWSTYGPLTKMPDINKVGEIFGFSFIMGNIPGFEEYLKTLRPSPGAKNDFIEEYKELRRNCSISPLNCGVGDLLEVMNLKEVYGQRVAVYAIAHGLKKLLKCNETACPGDINFPPWQLVENIRGVNFTLDGISHSFDKNGDFMDGYDLIRWTKTNDTRIIDVIGKFLLNEGKVELWSEYQGITVSHVTQSVFSSRVHHHRSLDHHNCVLKLPPSKCSESCPPGTSKDLVNTVKSCCYNCTECPEGTYTNKSDEDRCHDCPRDQWSTKKQTKCEVFQYTYLFWSDVYPIVLLVAAAIGITVVLTSFIIYYVHRETTIIKMADMKMSSFMLLGLMVSFVSVIMFIGRPNDHLCRAQQAVYGFGFTLCVSSILVKAFRTFLAFMIFEPNTKHQLNKLYKPLINVLVLTGGQGVILLFWLIFKPPNEDTVWPGKSGMVRRVPQDFNDSGVIIFSMLIHLFVWLCFIPIYINKNKTEQQHIVQASAVLASNYGIIFCHVVPKCFIVLWDFSWNSSSAILGRLRRHNRQNTKNPDITVLQDESMEAGPVESTPVVGTISQDDLSAVKTLRNVLNEDRGSVNSTQNRHARVKQRHTTN
ncbi:G-protein coupled receptor family C group 6 member A isoform X3 [Triplophysa dalaica]|uniref:G-protein coupled receptor family C group 6 member A isoform X3 n=1 Tax=Triplophysa dalaica TaxID=1582913 RepID=UPI0024DFB9CE|nr:G-protein coupled receptor family C group 6 member A isoform X3 [Triplophysa dalaica]